MAKYVSQCMPCQKTKQAKAIKPPVCRIPVVDRRFSDLQVDVVGPLPASRGMKYLLTILDRTSRWLEAIPMPEATSQTCCQAFIWGWSQRFGLPQSMTSDNGNTFVANLWKDLLQALGIDQKLTPPYHSSSLGGVERKHADIKASLKAALVDMADTHGSEWMDHLPWVLLGRRTAYQQDLKTTAAELALGMNPTLPAGLIGEPGPPLENEGVNELLRGLRAKNERKAIQTLAHSTENVNLPDLSKVTHVLVKKGKPPPLGAQYDGPFPIMDRIGDNCIRIKVGATASGEPRLELQHWNNCRPARMTNHEQEEERPRPGRKKKQTDNIETDTNTVINQEQEKVSTRPVREKKKPIRYS